MQSSGTLTIASPFNQPCCCDLEQLAHNGWNLEAQAMQAMNASWLLTSNHSESCTNGRQHKALICLQYLLETEMRHTSLCFEGVEVVDFEGCTGAACARAAPSFKWSGIIVCPCKRNLELLCVWRSVQQRELPGKVDQCGVFGFWKGKPLYINFDLDTTFCWEFRETPKHFTARTRLNQLQTLHLAVCP